MKLIRISFLFIVLVALLGSCNKKAAPRKAAAAKARKQATVARIIKNPDVEYRLRMAEQFYANKKYSKAQLIFEDLFPILRSDPRFEDLYYKFAYCAFYLKDYLQAENLFKGFLDVFPKSARAAEVDFMHAYCYYKQSPRIELDQTPTQKTIGFMQAHLNNYPESNRADEARRIIDEGYAKLEEKEYKGAELYYNMGSYRAAAIAFTNLLNHYPASEKGDQYKMMIIRSYYQYAMMSVQTKQIERYEKVLEEYYDFVDRFPESKLLKEAEKYFQNSQINLKALKNESSDKKS